MNLVIKTSILQEMVAKAVKGVGNNKLIPITQMMLLELKDGKFTLITTDSTNYLYVSQDNIQGENFYITVQVDTFSKLIARMTCENIEITLKETTLEVKGNGTYNIELPLDENGNLIKYPDPLSEFSDEGAKVEEVNLNTIQAILTTIKPALATTMEIPCYTGYYVGDRIIGTDSYMIASMDVDLFGEPRLISPEMMNLLDVMTEEKIAVTLKDNILVFNTNNCCVYGPILEGIEDFAVEPITQLLDSEFDSMCKISKNTVLQLLDRLSLFVGTYDNNGILLTFTEQGLQVSSKASNGVELIPYIESNNFKEFTCFIDIDMLQSQIKAQVSDAITMYYGFDKAIKMVDGNITQIVATLDI